MFCVLSCQCQRRNAANKRNDGCSACGGCLRTYCDRPTPIPALALRPLDATNKRGYAAGASPIMVRTLSVGGFRLKERHELTFHTLAAVEQRLRTDLKLANLVGPYMVVVHEAVHRCETH